MSLLSRVNYLRVGISKSLTGKSDGRISAFRSPRLGCYDTFIFQMTGNMQEHANLEPLNYTQCQGLLLKEVLISNISQRRRMRERERERKM